MSRLIYPDNNHLAAFSKFGRGGRVTGDWGACGSLSALFLANVPNDPPAMSKPNRNKAIVIYGAVSMMDKINANQVSAGISSTDTYRDKFNQRIFERAGIASDGYLTAGMQPSVQTIIATPGRYYVQISYQGQAHAIAIVNSWGGNGKFYIYDPNTGLKEYDHTRFADMNIRGLIRGLGFGDDCTFVVYKLEED